MTCKRPAPFAMLLPIFLLGACAAADGSYPSLAVREVERISGSALPATTAAPYTPPAPAADLEGRLARAVADARQAHARFTTLAQANRAAITGGLRAAEGSDAWARSLGALAELEGARSRGMIALADLDRLYVDAGAEGADLTAIGAAQGEVATLLAQEDAAIAQITGNP